MSPKFGEDLPLPEEPIGSRFATTGTVKWYEDDKGVGAIATDATAPWDVWCHFSAIEMAGFKRLDSGQKVEVDYARRDQDSFKYVAERVKPL